MFDTMNTSEIVMGEEKMPNEASLAHSTRATSGETDTSNLHCTMHSFNE